MLRCAVLGRADGEVAQSVHTRRVRAEIWMRRSGDPSSFRPNGPRREWLLEVILQFETALYKLLDKHKQREYISMGNWTWRDAADQDTQHPNSGSILHLFKAIRMRAHLGNGAWFPGRRGPLGVHLRGNYERKSKKCHNVARRLSSVLLPESVGLIDHHLVLLGLFRHTPVTSYLYFLP